MPTAFQRLLLSPLALVLLASGSGGLAWWWLKLTQADGPVYWLASACLVVTAGLLSWAMLNSFRIFDRYLWKQVWSAMSTGVMVLSGVMVLGNVYKKLDQLLGDAKLPISFVIEFIGLIIPFSLIFTIPWAFLTAILLVFGRLSADNEMVSLRMTGMPMWRICAPVFIMAIALSGVCFWVNVDLAPSAKNRMKRLFYDVAAENPISLFQPGRVLDKFPGYRIYVESRTDEGVLKNLQILEVEGTKPKTFIRAKSAVLQTVPGQLDFNLILKDANIEQAREDAEGNVSAVDSVRFGQTAMNFPLSQLKERTERVNASMKSTEELWGEVNSNTDAYTKLGMTKQERSASRTEVHKRYSFSLACITFCLVGIPLGITAQRRETTAGFVLSLITATVYFVFIMIAETQNDKPSVYPHILMWVPNVVFLGTGLYLFARLSRR